MLSRKEKVKPFGIVVAVALAALAFRYCPIPWSALSLITAVLLATFAYLNRRSGSRVLMVNLAAVFFALASFEGFIGVKQLRGDGSRIEGTIHQEFRADNMLGYAPNPNARLTAKKFYGDTLLYDVVYSIDEQGLRIAPPEDRTAPLMGCLVFFGDSLSFGEGVDDDQTFPYRVGVKANGRYAIRNFAFGGYGPHQMLATLQSKTFDQRVSCKPTHFFYLIIPTHVARVAGLTSWDRHGPRFRLHANDEVVRAGNFDDPARIFGQGVEPRWVQQALDKFFTWQLFFGRGRNPNEADLQLFIAVVQAAARLTKQRYPDSMFTVLLWDGDSDERFAAMENAWQRDGIQIHRISEAIPDIRSKREQYIIPYDAHPNALQHERIANYLINDILDGAGEPR